MQWTQKQKPEENVLFVAEEVWINLYIFRPVVVFFFCTQYTQKQIHLQSNHKCEHCFKGVNRLENIVLKG